MNISYNPKALTECDREPIHNIAAVQSFGGMLVTNSEWVISQRSVNCAKLLAIDALPEPGTNLADIIESAALQALREAASRLEGADAVERIFGIRFTEEAELFDCALHCSEGKFIIEFEPHDAKGYADHLMLMGPALAQLEPIRDLDTLCRKAAKLVKQMLGYDRVMIYKFYPDESGEVIAEEKREDLQSYEGLRYPRADIPQQARELFRRNRFRIIADMEEAPVLIEPTLSIKNEPLDLSMSTLRAHSQMHVQYMKNMGVKASLAIAIVRHGELWGMISCHHYEPRLPAYSLRTVADMFSQMFSLMIDRLLIDRSEELRSRGRALHDQLMVRLAGGAKLSEHLPMLEELLNHLIQHDGMSVLMDETYMTSGVAPTREQFLAITPTLGSMPISENFATSEIQSQIPQAMGFKDVAAGALALPISRSPRDYLVLWRRPLTQKVTWAGNPEKAVATPGERLQPRGSFDAWEQTVEGCSEEWSDDELQIAEGLRVTLLEIVLRMTDEISRERKKAQEQQELLIAELNHRVRNILNLISSLVQQSQGAAHDVKDFASIIGGRIAALASAHDNITRENWAPAPLSSLIESEFAAYAAGNENRCRLVGDDMLVTPEAYTVLALVLHELVTNSVKYGALSNETGRIEVTVGLSSAGALKLGWRESGGPPVKPPTRRSFGSIIIERSIPFELSGEADLRFTLGGVEADFVVPARFVGEKTEMPQEATKSRKAADASGTSGKTSGKTPKKSLPNRVLLVEDNMIIALGTEDNLRILGVEDIDVQSTVAGTLEAIKSTPPDFAILDFNLGTESSLAVSEELRAREIPFVVATGYSEIDDQINELGAEGVIQKPYGLEEIELALTTIIN
ncbi:Bacteriophytochrome (light-regulated signal transduction histidine kinase) [Erythrobacter sp. NAP1]|uniref:HWE histidine kinase domain-containing protein n=1 Tax=Erythrobacter sp. NAP1 TaxID=237727 RepID=UPI000068759E|nr:HWE histidine kinase domain-containing protein [Erythrobacter sp. NAP1]EAQ28960.1 Bacteriophytochrome (light-regulated signal transduction histidine kinase) [Erythrobacter sp. NAP1]